MNAVANINLSGNEITERSLKGVWKNIWPDLSKSEDIGHSVDMNEIVELAKQIGLMSAELISKKALEDHIDSAHNITIEKDTRTFDTFKDFKLWKESIEKQTSSLYLKNTGSKSRKTGGKITYFYCHCNGFYNARGDKKRNMKIAGSNKINGNFPSMMKVYEDIESKVTVEFTKTHVGHGMDKNN
ncbi:c2H2-type domain-containing protein [Trichonephila clavipes]|nr:c2H2-type domain-containing protein [Trichonephila clavipes]